MQVSGNSGKIYISKKVLAWTLLIHPFLKPNGIHGISMQIDRIYDAGIIASFLIILLIIIQKRKSLNKSIVLTGTFLLWILTLTFANKGQTAAVMRMLIQFIGLSMSAFILADNPRVLIRSMLLNLEILIYLNFICLLMFPHGMYISTQNGNWNNWLLGYDNQWFIVYFGAMFTAIANGMLTGKAFRSLVLVTVMHISAAIVMSGVIVFGLAIIDVLVITGLYKTNLIVFKTIWIIALAANVLLMFFSTSGLATFIIYNVFHKTSKSIPARLKIWSVTFDYLKNNWILGYGKEQTIQRLTMYHNNHGSNAHNFLLEILYEGGIIGMLLFAWLNMEVGIKMHSTVKSDISEVLLVCILACLVTGSVDSLLESRGALFFWMLSIGYNMPIINAHRTMTNKLII